MSKKTWFEENREKKINTVINRDFLIDMAELVILKNNGLENAFQQFKKNANGIGFSLTLDNLMSKNAFGQLFTPLINDEKYQEKMIGSLINSNLYKEFISELLLESIRDFIFDDNVFTRKIPILGPIIKLGQNVANNAKNKYAKIFETIENEIKTFVESNIRLIEGYSYTILKRTITKKNINNIIDFSWKNFKDHQLLIDDQFLPDESKINLKNLYRQVITGLIDSMLAKYGDKQISDFL